MKLNVADRMDAYEEGIFHILNQKKLQLLDKGIKVYNLSVGTPDFSPPEHVVEAVANAASDPLNYKYALHDLPQLIQQVKIYFQKRYKVSLEEEEIMSIYGSQEGIAHIALSICNPGDVVLVPNPGYPIFSIGPSLANVELHYYDLTEENHYLPDLEQIDPEILKKTKFILVSYPLNPICKTAPVEFYVKLIAWAKKHQIIILHDNAYSDIVYDGREGISILSIEGAKEIAVEFYSLSKTFNYTGARVGFLLGNSQLVENFKKFKSQIDYGTFLPVQYGAIAALSGDFQGVLDQCQIYQQRRDALCQGLRNLGWFIEDSEGTMFVWGKIPSFYQDDDIGFVMDLMEKTGVICTPGSCFGSLGKGHVRFALVLPVETIREAVTVIQKSGILNGILNEI